MTDTDHMTAARLVGTLLPAPPRSTRQAGKSAHDTARRRLLSAVRSAMETADPWGTLHRGHTAEQKFPGITDHAYRLHANSFTAAAADPKLRPFVDALRVGAAKITAAVRAAYLEYRHALAIAVEGGRAPTCDADWDRLAVEVGLTGVRDRVRLADHAIALARGRAAAASCLNLDARLKAAAAAGSDPQAAAEFAQLSAAELARRFGVTRQAVEKTEFWLAIRAARRAAKRELARR